jgi:hypothetical protein
LAVVATFDGTLRTVLSLHYPDACKWAVGLATDLDMSTFAGSISRRISKCGSGTFQTLPKSCAADSITWQ